MPGIGSASGPVLGTAAADEVAGALDVAREVGSSAGLERADAQPETPSPTARRQISTRTLATVDALT